MNPGTEHSILIKLKSKTTRRSCTVGRNLSSTVLQQVSHLNDGWEAEGAVRQWQYSGHCQVIWLAARAWGWARVRHEITFPRKLTKLYHLPPAAPHGFGRRSTTGPLSLRWLPHHPSKQTFGSVGYRHREKFRWYCLVSHLQCLKDQMADSSDYV